MATYITRALKRLPILLSIQLAFAQTAPTELNIAVLQGEGAVVKARQRPASPLSVRVEDQDRKPVSGAVVIFTLPTEGATGEFGNNVKTLTVITDSQGQAAAAAFRTNEVPGKVPVHINASYRGLAARTTITVFNVAPAGAKASSGKGHGKLIAVLVAIGGAAGAGAALGMRKSSTPASPSTPPSTPAVTPIGITAGSGSIVAPPH